MDTFKDALAYWKQLRSNEIDHGDILAFRMIPVMRKFLLWWTDEDYKNTPKWAKVIYLFLGIRLWTGTALALLHLAIHPSSKPPAAVLQDVAVCLAAIVGSSGTIIFPFFRNRSSALLRTINQINRGILERSHNALENRRTSNRLFISIPILCAVLETTSLSIFVLFAWEFTNSGLPQYNSFLHQPTPFSVVAYVEEILFLVTGFWMMSSVTFFLCMYFEFILRISFYFRVTAEEMRQLRRGVKVGDEENEELQKLKLLIKDLHLLYWCVDEYNATLRFFTILYLWLAFVTLGLYAAAFLLIGSITKSTQLIGLLFYNASLTASLCAIGQHLKDSADEVVVGIYDCDWYTAPLPFRKLVLNVLTRCKHDTLFKADPFYDLDLLLLTRVMRTTYTLIALFAKAIK